MAKYLKLLDETESVTSTNRGFRTKNHSVATYEQKIKECVVLILNERLRQMEFIRFDGKFMFFLYEVFDQIYTLLFAFINFYQFFCIESCMKLSTSR